MSFEDTWACHICGEVRPDARISVHKKPLVMASGVIHGVFENIRYCNDRKGCFDATETFSFLKEESTLTPEEKKYISKSYRFKDVIGAFLFSRIKGGK